MVISRADLIREAQELKSERGENPEYDRALAELIYWTCNSPKAGPASAGVLEKGVEAVMREIGIDPRKAVGIRESGGRSF
jgi:hypothetical protein